MNMFNMMGKLGEAQDRMEALREKMKTVIIRESEMDDAVVVEISGDRQVKKITTSGDFYTRFSKEEREDILTEAINNALLKVEAAYKEEMNRQMEGIIPNIPGLDLSAFGF
jgi:DNA-binding protein YbaB